ncbi:hypothetical protein N7450_010880 [Penicillium hetheringtonii]|uniref:Uncharacterized protein n=1 Tax=Penicillium hetheringtonii TaxID=911720 RepID=A0AAD6DB18_9EURO|nr:hypothetical protein N7450_010880 [Penicillium hetheringtonii]
MHTESKEPPPTVTTNRNVCAPASVPTELHCIPDTNVGPTTPVPGRSAGSHWLPFDPKWMGTGEKWIGFEWVGWVLGFGPNDGSRSEGELRRQFRPSPMYPAGTS